MASDIHRELRSVLATKIAQHQDVQSEAAAAGKALRAVGYGVNTAGNLWWEVLGQVRDYSAGAQVDAARRCALAALGDDRAVRRRFAPDCTGISDGKPTRTAGPSAARGPEAARQALRSSTVSGLQSYSSSGALPYAYECRARS